MQYVWLVLAWVIYFAHHSIFSASVVRERLKKIGLSKKAQRLIYSALSTLGLLLILLYNGVIGGEPLLREHRLLKAFALFLAAGGVFIIREAFKAYSLSSFLGFSEESSEELKITGILQYIRHPLYAATILIFIGFFLYDSRLASLVSLICVLAYLPLGIWLEEKKLVQMFGERYIKYSKEVPMLIPDLKKR